MGNVMLCEIYVQVRWGEKDISSHITPNKSNLSPTWTWTSFPILTAAISFLPDVGCIAKPDFSSRLMPTPRRGDSLSSE